MSLRAPSLFKPWTIPGSGDELVAPNHIVVPPMCMYSATNGEMGPFHEMHYGSMCTSGAGLVIIEATAVVPEGRITSHCCGIWDDKTAAAMKRVLDRVRSYSSVPIAIQLQHAGRKGSYFSPARNDGVGQIAPGAAGGVGWQTVAPSAIPFNEAEHPPKEMSKADIAATVKAFADSAVRAVDIGIQAIELHFAHGYLAHQFLSPWSNARTDEYGGSLENRMRFALETFEAVRAAVPAKVPVWVRLSATDWTREAGLEKGWCLEEAIVLCKRLKEMGCALVHVSSGGASPKQEIQYGPGYQLPHSKAIREEVGIPTIAVGLIQTAGEAEVALATGAADAIAIGRAMLFNPHWPYEAARALGAAVPHAPRQYYRSDPLPHLDVFGVSKAK